MKNKREDGSGIFIVFEGVDGSGETTQANLITKKLREEGYKVSISSEPTDNLVGGLIRGQLTHEWEAGQECLQLLFAADRSHHLERDIFPTLNKGGMAVTTRYFYSSIAYGGLDLSKEWIEEVNSRFPKADVGFYLDVSIEECLRRIEERPSKELFEKKEKMRKIKRNYQKLVDEREEIHRIDGEREIEKVHEDIKKKIDDYIEQNDPNLSKRPTEY